MMREHGCPRLIHGHTHLSARHEHRVDGRVCERWVLPVLVCEEKGYRAEELWGQECLNKVDPNLHRAANGQ
jgi:UDP-2,3-diacylglucosamine pyrophosphatase LpxH